MLCLVAACDSSDSAEEAEQTKLEEASVLRDQLAGSEESGQLTVQLAFDSDVDLDLYVTGPLLETVYYANRESKSGGEISDDVRCDTETDGARIETVIYQAPMKGRYRVGVDFPHRCSGDTGPAAFAVLVESPGEDLEKKGTVIFERFEVAVLEFEL